MLDPFSTAMLSSDYPMLPVPHALEIVLREAQPLLPRLQAAEDALGRVLAEPVTAAAPLPPFAASVKDGYAVVASDGPGVYALAGRIAAGQMADFTLRSGQVAYITTGAPLPAGADAVVQVEDTRPAGEGAVEILRTVRAGEDVRPVGHDIDTGAHVLAAGERLGPAELGLIATVGVTEVLAYPLPRVGVLSTGDELAPAGAPLQPGHIYDSNGPTLRAAVAWAGGQVVDFGIAPDTEAPLRALLAEALATCDVVLTSGGVSMGELDLIKTLVAEAGTIHFGRLNMKPGKPCTFATIPPINAGVSGARHQCLVFGLPGNPVSSLVTFYLMALPAIRRMAGWRQPMLPRVQAILAGPIQLDPSRPEYHRARLTWESDENGGAGGWRAASTGSQASSRLLSMHGANALLELPQGDGELPTGSVVGALVIDVR
jgi:gephyrin